LKENPVAVVFKDRVEELKSTMPVVTYLRDPALKEEHWNEIYEILGITLNLEDDYFTLSSLIDLNVKKDKDKLGEVSLKANKEAELEF
jgi:dynein heavy chain